MPLYKHIDKRLRKYQLTTKTTSFFMDNPLTKEESEFISYGPQFGFQEINEYFYSLNQKLYIYSPSRDVLIYVVEFTDDNRLHVVVNNDCRQYRFKGEYEEKAKLVRLLRKLIYRPVDILESDGKFDKKFPCLHVMHFKNHDAVRAEVIPFLIDQLEIHPRDKLIVEISGYEMRYFCVQRCSVDSYKYVEGEVYEERHYDFINLSRNEQITRKSLQQEINKFLSKEIAYNETEDDYFALDDD